MTPSEKAVATRRRNKEARKSEKLAIQILTEKALETCEKIFDDPDATSEERLWAIELFKELKKSR